MDEKVLIKGLLANMALSLADNPLTLVIEFFPTILRTIEQLCSEEEKQDSKMEFIHWWFSEFTLESVKERLKLGELDNLEELVISLEDRVAHKPTQGAYIHLIESLKKEIPNDKNVLEKFLEDLT